jgi:hypothetical protein
MRQLIDGKVLWVRAIRLWRPRRLLPDVGRQNPLRPYTTGRCCVPPLTVLLTSPPVIRTRLARALQRLAEPRMSRTRACSTQGRRDRLALEAELIHRRQP